MFANRTDHIGEAEMSLRTLVWLVAETAVIVVALLLALPFVLALLSPFIAS